MSQAGYLHQTATGWVVVLRVAGERFKYGPREDARLRGTRKQAEEWAARKNTELHDAARRKAAGLRAEVRFSELVADYQEQELPGLAPGTRRTYTGCLEVMRRYFDQRGNPKLEDIHAQQIKQYLSWRRANRQPHSAGDKKRRTTKAEGQRLHPRTVAKDWAILHALFRFADQMEYREGNPVARVPAPKADPHAPVLLTDSQYEALLRECERYPMLWLYVLTLGETAMRGPSEARWIRWEDVDLAGGFIAIVSGRDGHRTKTGKSRFCPMTARLHEAMREHFARYRLAARSPWIFFHVADGSHHRAGAQIADDSFRGALMSAAARANLPPDWRPHDLRHGKITGWLAGGNSPVLVKEAVGHSDLRTTMRYTHLVKTDLRALVEPKAAPPAAQGDARGA